MVAKTTWNIFRVPTKLRNNGLFRCLGDRAYSNSDIILSPSINSRNNPTIDLMNATLYHYRSDFISHFLL